MCSGRQICTDKRFSRLKETIWFLLIQLKLSVLFCFRNKWCCHVTPVGLKSSGVPLQPCRAVWHLVMRPENRKTAWVGYTPQACIPVVFIGSYSAVGRQGRGREHAVMLLAVMLSARENGCVFAGFLWVGYLVGWFGVFLLMVCFFLFFLI